MPLQTLITGFGPFGTVISNPTARLVEWFEQEPINGHEITTCLLPTSFRHAPEIMAAALEKGGREGQPFNLILMLGVAQNSPGWRVERYGRNWNNAYPDVDGYAPTAGPILPDASNLLPVTLPVDDLVAALHRAGLPAVASDSAGGYLCNHILFHVLHWLDKLTSPVQAGFLHVPADGQTYVQAPQSSAASTFAQQIVAVRTVLEAIAASQERRVVAVTPA